MHPNDADGMANIIDPDYSLQILLIKSANISDKYNKQFTIFQRYVFLEVKKHQRNAAFALTLVYSEWPNFIEFWPF